jgi:hypothetical protein
MEYLLPRCMRLWSYSELNCNHNLSFTEPSFESSMICSYNYPILRHPLSGFARITLYDIDDLISRNEWRRNYNPTRLY